VQFRSGDRGDKNRMDRAAAERLRIYFASQYLASSCWYFCWYRQQQATKINVISEC
jgi:hypothetical protein